jgi:hypothetical protein
MDCRVVRGLNLCLRKMKTNETYLSGDIFEAVYLIGVMLFEVRTLMNCNYSYISPVKEINKCFSTSSVFLILCCCL